MKKTNTQKSCDTLPLKGQSHNSLTSVWSLQCGCTYTYRYPRYVGVSRGAGAAAGVARGGREDLTHQPRHVSW